MTQKARMKIFRGIAGYMSFYHLIFSLLVIFFGEWGMATTSKILYGADVVITPQTLYFSKFIAAYGIAFGVMMLLLALQPERYRNIVWAAVALVVVRVFERIFFYDLLNEAFGITMSSNIITITIISIFAGALVLFMPKEKSNQ